MENSQRREMARLACIDAHHPSLSRDQKLRNLAHERIAKLKSIYKYRVTRVARTSLISALNCPPPSPPPIVFYHRGGLFD